MNILNDESNNREGRENLIFLQAINSLEEHIQKLKKEIASSGRCVFGSGGGNGDDAAEIAAASAIMSENGRKLKELTNFIWNKAESTAVATSHDLIFATLGRLDNNDNVDDRDGIWNEFHNKLKTIGAITNKEFKKVCCRFPPDDGGRRNTLFHEFFRYNPPVDVVQTLLDMMPEGLLVMNTSNDYPLDVMMICGGSVDVVKLLVSRDAELETIKEKTTVLYRSNNIWNFLFENRNRHHHNPNDFSKILHYLVQTTMDRLPYDTISVQSHGGFLPLELFYEQLHEQKFKSLYEDVDDAFVAYILKDEDFIFLVKATYYCHVKASHCKNVDKSYEDNNDTNNDDDDNNNKSDIVDTLGGKINDIPFFYAFLICSSCFHTSFATRAIETLLIASPENKKILLDHGNNSVLHSTPVIFQILFNPRYFIRASPQWEHVLAISEIILKYVPSVAQHTNEDGLFPLHIAADPRRLKMKREDKNYRFSLVRMIWRAYPEALDVMEKDTDLPLFLVPSWGQAEFENRSNHRSMVLYSDDDGVEDWTVVEDFLRSEADLEELEELKATERVSTSFFLLRQKPEMLSIAMSSATGKCEDLTSEVAASERSAKRLRQK